MFVSLCLRSLICELGISLFFPNLIQVTDSHQCHCHCCPVFRCPSVAFPSHFLPCSCRKGVEQVHRMRSSVRQALSWCKQRSWTPSELLGWSIWKGFVAVSFHSVPGGGYGWAGGCGQRAARSLDGFCSRNLSLAIKERLFKALRVYL